LRPCCFNEQLPTPGRLCAQFAVWYLTLVFSRRGIQGYWSPLLVAGVADNFWLAVCFGGCVVRPAPSASQSAKTGADSHWNTLFLAQCMLHALAGSFGIAGRHEAPACNMHAWTMP